MDEFENWLQENIDQAKLNGALLSESGEAQVVLMGTILRMYRQFHAKSTPQEPSKPEEPLYALAGRKGFKWAAIKLQQIEGSGPELLFDSETATRYYLNGLPDAKREGK